MRIHLQRKEQRCVLADRVTSRLVLDEKVANSIIASNDKYMLDHALANEKQPVHLENQPKRVFAKEDQMGSLIS